MKTEPLQWLEELPFAVTVCDRNYRILYMNDKAAEGTAKEGGKNLVGKSLMGCHPPKAQRKLRKVMSSGRPYVFTIEGKGNKKLVYEGHWRKGGNVGGLLEIYFDLPKEIPNLLRD